MPVPTAAELLRFIAREEPLTDTVRAFRGLTREHLGALLEAASQQLGGPPPPAAEPSPAAEPAPAGSAPATYPRLRVYSDGAARGNPGPAGAGAVLLDPNGAVVERVGKFLGRQTNNHAEYTGLLLGLERARALGAAEVDVYADSELLIRQLGGQYQVKSATLKPLFDEARRRLGEFTRVRLHHVPREQNKLADEMSNRAIDERL